MYCISLFKVGIALNVKYLILHYQYTHVWSLSNTAKYKEKITTVCNLTGLYCSNCLCQMSQEAYPRVGSDKLNAARTIQAVMYGF